LPIAGRSASGAPATADVAVNSSSFSQLLRNTVLVLSGFVAVCLLVYLLHGCSTCLEVLWCPVGRRVAPSPEPEPPPVEFEPAPQVELEQMQEHAQLPPPAQLGQ